MTTAITQEVDRRRGRPRKDQRERDYFAASLAGRIRQDQIYVSRVRFPSPLYRERPIEFFHEVLGIEPWARQVEIIEAVRDHGRVAVCSGHKCGKSSVSAGLALWFFCSFTDARVVMTSTTSRQVDQILWRELRMMRTRSGRCLACKAEDPEGLRIPKPCPHSTLIEGEQGDLARTGLKTPDFREIVGFTAREAEAVAGISGQNLLYIVDEASGVSDEIFEAIEGNRAGGARIVLLSNPTKNEGEFFEAFHAKARYYKTVRMSSEETPNVVHGRIVIPGLATREWIAEKREEWGEDSPLYKVRVKGEHAMHEDGKIFSVHAIGESEARWSLTPEAGRLYIGLDPAGETGRGDETMFAARRGLKLLGFYPYRGLNEEQHFVRTLQLVADLRSPRETPVLVVDRSGPIGTPLFRRFLNYLETKPLIAFELVGMDASHKPVRQPGIYDRLRDELTANLECWIRDGGAVVEDVKLAAELHAMEWTQHVNGKLKVTEKEKLRKILGRSPDRYDALALSCWEPLSLQADLPESAAQVIEHDEYSHEHTLDPYASGDMWRTK